jgi:hypothetical protein
MAAAYFFPLFHVVLSEAATVQPDYNLTKIWPIRVITIFDEGLPPRYKVKTNLRQG